MPTYLYGGKIGMSSVIRLTIKLCDIFMPNAQKIKDYVNASTAISTEQKSVLVAWLDGIVTACEILRILQVVTES